MQSNFKIIKVVGAVIINNENKILIAKRKMDDSCAGKWEFPGGKIEEGETQEEALIREIKEELDIEVKIGNFITENSTVSKNKHLTLYTYFAEFLSGEIKIIDHEKINWVTKKELLHYNFTEADFKTIRILTEKKLNDI